MSSVPRCKIKEGRPDPAMLTTRPLGRNETFSPTAANYGLAVVPLVVTVHMWSQPKERNCQKIHTTQNMQGLSSHRCGFLLHNFPGFLNCRRRGRRTSPALGRRARILGPSGEMPDLIDICPDKTSQYYGHVPGQPSL